jgi:cytochrome-b5 reductase
MLGSLSELVAWHNVHEHAAVHPSKGLCAAMAGWLVSVQVADHILDNPADKTKVSLIFANVSEDDILLNKKIDKMAAQHPDRFKVYYVVDKPK